MKRVTASQFASNSIWKFTEIICRKIISLIISTILARLLIPEAYGVVALTTVFITFSDIFILNGFNVALVRKEKIEDIDYSTVTVLSLVFCTILYLIFFFSAPLVASFYDTPELKQVLRVITLLLFFQAIATVIRSKGTREMKFKEMSGVAVLGNTIASVAGVVAAYKGFGVWALVIQQVLVNILDMAFLMLVFKWHISFKFSWNSAKEMIRFTTGVMSASFLDFLGNNLNSLIIGKVYTTSELGYYNRGNMYPETIALNTYNSINSVLLPTLTSRREDNDEMKRVVRKVVSVTEYIILPMMFGLIAISDVFIRLLLTDRWLPALPILVCSSLYYCINPIRAIGNNVFYARGESGRCVRIEIFRSVLMIGNLVITIILFRKDIYALAATNVIIALGVAITTQYQVCECIHYRFGELIRDVMPSLLMSLGMGTLARLVCFANLNDLYTLLLQIIIGIAFYIGMSAVTKNKNYTVMVEFLKKRFWKR